MFNQIFTKKKKNMPRKETEKKYVSSQRFNDMINYYTAELKSRLTEIKKLKQENDLLIRASIRTASRTDEFQQQNLKLRETINQQKDISKTKKRKSN